jgi:hypothetical protein
MPEQEFEGAHPGHMEQLRDKLKNFLDEGLYLPAPIRDDEERMTLINRIKSMIPPEDAELIDLTPNDIHRLIVNKFLWFMAAHGYTLQKTRMKAPFYDLDMTMREFLAAHVSEEKEIRDILELE